MEACNNYDGGEKYYTLAVPTGYKPSPKIRELSTDEWLQKLDRDERKGKIRWDLAAKIEHSLRRMPDLNPDQTVSVSYSGGKDSQAIFLLARMRYPKNRIISLFADTDDEWPESYTAIDEMQAWIGIPIHRLQSIGIHTLLRGEHVAQTGYRYPGYWPGRGNGRHCTKNLKMIPQRDWFDEEGYDQDRQRGVAAYRNGTPITVQFPQPLTLAGERWAESRNRGTLPFDSRDDVMLRWTHRPVLDWRIEDIWDFIFYMQAPINLVYTMGIKRAACAGCIFASAQEAEILGEHYPQRLLEWVKTEASIGHPWKHGGNSFKEIYDRLEADNRLGTKLFYQFDGDEITEIRE